MPNSPARSVLGKRLLRFFGCGETGCFACFWRCVHEFALFLWVARAPFGVVAVGYLLLGAAPQAQDLLISLVDSSPPYVLLFFVLHFLFWAMPVHYSARILLSDDKRLYEYGLNNPSPYFDWLERWIPRLLGAVTFLALIMSAYRANSNLPNIKDHGVITTLSKNLYYFMGWSVVGFVVFLNYTAYRTKMAERVPSSLLDKLTSLTRPLLNLLDIGGHRSARPFKPDEYKSRRYRVAVADYRICYLRDRSPGCTKSSRRTAAAGFFRQPDARWLGADPHLSICDWPTSAGAVDYWCVWRRRNPDKHLRRQS